MLFRVERSASLSRLRRPAALGLGTTSRMPAWAHASSASLSASAWQTGDDRGDEAGRDGRRRRLHADSSRASRRRPARTIARNARLHGLARRRRGFARWRRRSASIGRGRCRPPRRRSRPIGLLAALREPRRPHGRRRAGGARLLQAARDADLARRRWSWRSAGAVALRPAAPHRRAAPRARAARRRRRREPAARSLLCRCWLFGARRRSRCSPTSSSPIPALEARARDISGGLRCLVCQNQSIDDSDAPLARDLRLLVRERLKAGDSDDAGARLPGRPLWRIHPAQAALRARDVAAVGDAGRWCLLGGRSPRWLASRQPAKPDAGLSRGRGTAPRADSAGGPQAAYAPAPNLTNI